MFNAKNGISKVMLHKHQQVQHKKKPDRKLRSSICIDPLWTTN